MVHSSCTQSDEVFQRNRLWGLSFLSNSNLFSIALLCYTSEGKGILSVRSLGMPQGHGSQQTSHKEGLKKPRKMAASAWVGSSRELSKRQDLYSIGVGAEPFRVGIGQISSPELGLSTL